MGSFPWGPHGPETSPHAVKPNPTAAQPVGPFGGAEQGGAFPMAASGAGAGAGGPNPLLSIVVSLCMVPLVWMFWICMYPMTAAATVFTGAVAAAMLSRVLTAPDEASIAYVGGVIAGFAAAIVVSRIEYKLAENAGLRRGRHVVRLVLFGALAIPWWQGVVMNTTIGGSQTRYIFAVLTHPQFLLAQLLKPQNLVIVAVVMVGMHFLLWKAERVRAFWHRRLFWLGLK